MDEEDDRRRSSRPLLVGRVRRRQWHTVAWALLVVVLFAGSVQCQPVTANSVSKIGDDLSRHLSGMFKDATKWEDITRVYSKVTIPEVFDPRSELKHIKKHIEKYLSDRAKMAWDAKVSLESRDLGNFSSTELNDPMSANFVRYINAKTSNDGTMVYSDGHSGKTEIVNSTRELELQPNVNFYRIRTSSEASAVHVPTPVYNRSPGLLERIEWSDIDQLYRRNREKIKDLSFQKFCSDNGFMRYFPAAPWIYDNVATELDMFDCRNTEWFIDAATMSKNMIIMLDMSGSMLGQRFEIAKQTIEAILETLSDNDFFNIMPFSRTSRMLDECAPEGLLQATMRNKKLLRRRILNVTSEGKAEYEKALTRAFTTLLNLPDPVIWKSKEEYALELERQIDHHGLRHHVLEDSVLAITDRHHKAIVNGTRMGTTQMGCNDVIMLITDGAPGYFKEIFEIYNKDKRVRFFSFLIGEEAIDFDQVKWMACTNRGYMVHVSNMADVQEKVQHYVKVMSRPISRQTHAIHRNNAVWGSVSKERMSNQYVISVGFPVVVEDQFMGVSAVSVPMVELTQIAHPSSVGATSYFFMLDNNGYTMFHPQLRTIDFVTKETKPTYNNMDFAHVEVQRPLTDATEVPQINCDHMESVKANVLYAVEGVRRVYAQRNTYIAECIDGTQFTVGIAIAEGDDVRLNRRERIDYSQVELGWFRDKNWRIHPEWRYCLLNDSDTTLSAEAAFSTYATQMRNTGRLPELCQPRKSLVDRLLIDIQTTNSFSALWDEEWQQNKKNGVHLTYFATPSGLIRYYNESLEDMFYEELEAFVNGTDRAYRHFILEQNRRASDDDYFKRAVRMKNKIVFDVNLRSQLWTPDSGKTAYGHKENETLLAVAYKALFHDQALIGVVGIEFVYDRMAAWLKQHGCNPQNEQTRCFLLDEHGYIFYSSQKDISYESTLREYEYSQRHPYYSRKSAIGRFFGHLNRITEWTMEMLVDRGFYKKIMFVDNQAMCDAEVPVTADASVITVPFMHLKRVLLYAVVQVLNLVASYSSLLSTSLFAWMTPPAVAYTTTFKTPTGGRLPCQKQSPFYMADTDHSRMVSASLLDADNAERPCKQNAAQCAIRVYAHWIDKTNLLLVVVNQDNQSSCYDETQCPMSNPPALPFSFVKTADSAHDQQLHGSESDRLDVMSDGGGVCDQLLPPRRKKVMQCMKEEYVDESDLPCSISPPFHSTSSVAICAVFLSLLMFYHF